MFGNRLGWGISAVLAAVMILITWYIGTLNVMSAPSTGIVARTGNVKLDLLAHPELLDPIQLPFNPQAVMPNMTDAKDAGPLYRQAMEKYNSDKYTYRDLFEPGKPKTTDLKDLPALQFLIDARNCKTMILFAKEPRDVIEYDRAAADHLEAIYILGKTASHLSLYIKKDQPDKALLLAEAAFSLGDKLCEERLRWREFEAGADVLRESAFVIKSLDPARAAAADIDVPMRDLLKNRCMPLWIAIGSADPDVISRTAGDIFYIAKNSKERMWKIEAILKLGRNKYDMGSFGRGADQRWARLTVKRMANDQTLDPVVRTAAKAANELTHEGYNMIGG
jgi:hypothetical protein